MEDNFDNITIRPRVKSNRLFVEKKSSNRLSTGSVVSSVDRPHIQGRNRFLREKDIIDDVQLQLDRFFDPSTDSTENPYLAVGESCILHHYFKAAKLLSSVKSRALGVYATRDLEIGDVRLLYYGKIRAQNVHQGDPRGYRMLCPESDSYFENPNRVLVVDASHISSTERNALAHLVNHAPANLANCSVEIRRWNFTYIVNTKKILKGEELYFPYSNSSHNKAFFPTEDSFSMFEDKFHRHKMCGCRSLCRVSNIDEDDKNSVVEDIICCDSSSSSCKMKEEEEEEENDDSSDENKSKIQSILINRRRQAKDKALQTLLATVHEQDGEEEEEAEDESEMFDEANTLLRNKKHRDYDGDNDEGDDSGFTLGTDSKRSKLASQNEKCNKNHSNTQNRNQNNKKSNTAQTRLQDALLAKSVSQEMKETTDSKLAVLIGGTKLIPSSSINKCNDPTLTDEISKDAASFLSKGSCMSPARNRIYVSTDAPPTTPRDVGIISRRRKFELKNERIKSSCITDSLLNASKGEEINFTFN